MISLQKPPPTSPQNWHKWHHPWLPYPEPLTNHGTNMLACIYLPPCQASPTCSTHPEENSSLPPKTESGEPDYRALWVEAQAELAVEKAVRECYQQIATERLLRIMELENGR